MRVIHKYTLSNPGTIIDFPQDAVVLSVQMQVGGNRKTYTPGGETFDEGSHGWNEGLAVMWVLVDPTTPNIRCKIGVVRTGQELPDDYLDTHVFLTSIQDGASVWHLFISEAE